MPPLSTLVNLWPYVLVVIGVAVAWIVILVAVRAFLRTRRTP